MYRLSILYFAPADNTLRRLRANGKDDYPGTRSAAATRHGTADADHHEGPPQHSPEEIDAIAREQGTGPIDDLDALAGSFWPEDESCDDFIAAYRSWRREGTSRRR